MHFLKIIALLTCILFTGCSDGLNDKCQKMSKLHIEQAKLDWKRDYTLIRTEGFYSKKYDACIHVEVRDVGIENEIRDLSKSILKDGGNYNLLLHCDENGADSVRIDKVQEHHGIVLNLDYKDFLDDGYGGLPRALKTPAIPYTKSDCRKILDKWLIELKQ